jgi:starch-binding outer membrane protein, SusD/RagB family
MNLEYKKYLKKLTIAALATVMLTFSGCEDVLETNPRQSIDFDLALNTRDGVAGAINSIYARLRSVRYYGRDMIAIPEALADNGRATNNSGRLIGEFNNNQGVHFTGTLWQNAYSAINEINLILEAIPLLTDPLATDVLKAQWIGELYFLRALYHFDLARVYSYDPGVAVAARDKGGVPISTTAFKTVAASLESKPSRNSVTEVYAQIYSDLDQSIANLPATATDPYRANLTAAHGLYSRVALYNKDFAKSVAEATLALAPAGVGSLQNGNAYVNGWRATLNPESMFELRFVNADENIGVNEAIQTGFTTITGVSVLGTPQQTTAVGGWGDLVPTAGLLTELQLTTSGSGAAMTIVRGNADTRGLLYAVGPGRGSGQKIENIKFLGKSGTPNLDNVPLLRHSEVYLNRAEAYMSQAAPDETAARADLNAIRVARGLPADNASTGAALLNEILRQRRIELAFEGHRFFDLKRRGVDIVKLPANVTYDDTRILPPLPQREIDGNPNLAQNDGY